MVTRRFRKSDQEAWWRDVGKRRGMGSFGKKQWGAAFLHHAVVCVRVRRHIVFYIVSILCWPVLQRLYFCLVVLVTDEDYHMKLCNSVM